MQSALPGEREDVLLRHIDCSILPDNPLLLLQGSVHVRSDLIQGIFRLPVSGYEADSSRSKSLLFLPEALHRAGVL